MNETWHIGVVGNVYDVRISFNSELTDEDRLKLRHAVMAELQEISGDQVYARPAKEGGE